MASKTMKTESRRQHKANTRGKKRKAALRTQGSTKSEQALFGESAPAKK